jgi:hypothetical protein
MAWSPPGTVTTTYRCPVEHQADAEKALRNITMGGGTPGHRWLTAAVNDIPTGLKVASTEEEAGRELDRVAAFVTAQGIPRQALSVIRPAENRYSCLSAD